MEVFRAGEILADQFGAGDLTILLDQAAIGLMREQQLTQPCHAQGISEARQDREQHDHQDCGADLFEHGGFLKPDRWP